MIDIAKYRDECFDVVGAIYNVKNGLGPGLNEKIYQEALAIELAVQGIPFEKEKAVHPIYRGREMQSVFFLDFFCKDKIIVELKAVSGLGKDHRAQLFNYMHLVRPMAGILVNFAPAYAEVERYYYDKDAGQVIDINGKNLRNTVDDDITFYRVK